MLCRYAAVSQLIERKPYEELLAWMAIAWLRLVTASFKLFRRLNLRNFPPAGVGQDGTPTSLSGFQPQGRGLGGALHQRAWADLTGTFEASLVVRPTLLGILGHFQRC